MPGGVIYKEKSWSSMKSAVGKRSLMSSLLSLFEYGKYNECLQGCQHIYIKSPSDLDNLLLLSSCHFQLKQLQQSLFYGQQALGIDANFVEALILVGNCLKEQGKLEEAEVLYRKALRLAPRCPHAYSALGCIHYERNEIQRCADYFEMAVTLDPTSSVFRTNFGLALIGAGDKEKGKEQLTSESKSALAQLALGNLAHKEGSHDQAVEYYTQALQLQPAFIAAAINLCGSQIELFKASGDRNIIQEALSRLHSIVTSFRRSPQSAYSKLSLCYKLCGSYEQAHRTNVMTLDLTDTDALCNLASLQYETGNKEQAVKLCQRALQADPKCANAFCTLGLALFQMGCVDDALKCLRMSVKLEPNANAFSNFGAMLHEMGDCDAAIKLHRNAIAVDPSHMSAFLNLGNAYFGCGKLDYAEQCYQTSIDSNSTHKIIALNNLALLHLSRKQVDKAVGIVGEMLQKMDLKVGTSAMAMVDAYSCQWEYQSNVFEQNAGPMLNSAMHPFLAQINPQISPEMALSIASSFSRRIKQRALHGRSNKCPYKHDLPNHDAIIRIGYVSSGVGLSNGTFNHHDGNKFQVILFDLAGSDDGRSKRSALREGIEFVDLSEKNCVEAADAINERDVHILVNLYGYCQGSLPEIFALRPAPIQINMACSTMGCDSGMDYILADETTIPEDHRQFYSEKVMYMPGIANSCPEPELGVATYLETDRSTLRERLGINADSIVYACFSEPWKIDPELFQVWMEILQDVPSSVLVLVRCSSAMETNLRKGMLSKHSIADERVMFLDLVQRKEHLARCCLADVFLDTRVCGDITAIDALRCGVPLITIAGDRLSKRVTASLLRSVGLPELVATNLVEYKELAIALSDRERLLDLIHLLDENRADCTLFNTKSWVRAFEASLELAIEGKRQGK